MMAYIGISHTSKWSQHPSPDQGQDFVAEIFKYCWRRYQNVRGNAANCLKFIQVQGDLKDSNTYRRVWCKVNELLQEANQEERQWLTEFWEKFHHWRVDPLSVCFGESGLIFNTLDGSLKSIPNCHDNKVHVVGRCSVAV